MAHYVSLLNFTTTGEQHFKESPQRAADFKKRAAKMGVKVKEMFWTMGVHDGVIIFEAENDETAAAALVSLSAHGNVHTQTLRAFTPSEIDGIVTKAFGGGKS